MGPPGAGKTRLAEGLAAAAKVVRQAASLAERPLLEVDEAVGPRGGGLVPAWAWLLWQGHRLHLVDTPGAPEVSYPASLARWGASLDVLVLGEEPLPRALVTPADLGEPQRPAVLVFSRSLTPQRLRERAEEVAGVLGRVAVPLLHPAWGPTGLLGGAEGAEAHDARRVLVEAVANAVEAVVERFLTNGDLSDEEAWEALAVGTQQGALLPVFSVDAASGVGVESLLDALVRLTPPPVGDPQAPLQLEVVGTWLDASNASVTMLRVAHGELLPNARVVDAAGRSLCVHKPYRVRGPRRAVADVAGVGEIVGVWEDLDVLPGETLGAEGRSPPTARPPLAWRRLSASDARSQDKLPAALHTLLRFDPSLRGSVVGRGLADLAAPSRAHIELLARRLRTVFGVEATLGPQPVAWQERPTGVASGITGRCVRPERGEDVERATLEITLGPSEDDAPLWVEVEVDEEDLPTEHRQALTEGLLRGLARGGPRGLPTVGVHVAVVGAFVDVLDGESYHVAEAAEDAVSRALIEAGTRVWEPWVDVLVIVADEHVGPMLSAIGSCRGRTKGLDVDGGETSIRAVVPDTQLEALGARMESLTHGRGWMFSRPSHHEPLPAQGVEGPPSAAVTSSAGRG